jgi:RNA polymerase sigma factor (sigma-70 family)
VIPATEILKHEGFIRNAISGVRHKEADHEDLMQEGYLALLESTRRFDEQRGVKFLSFAGLNVRYRLWKYARKRSSILKLPATSTAKRGRNQEAFKRAIQQGRFVHVDDVEIPARSEYDTDLQDQLERMRKAIDELPDDRQREIALLKLQGLTGQKIGEKLGVSKQRIDQIWQKTRDLLWEALRAAVMLLTLGGVAEASSYQQKAAIDVSCDRIEINRTYSDTGKVCCEQLIAWSWTGHRFDVDWYLLLPDCERLEFYETPRGREVTFWRNGEYYRVACATVTVTHTQTDPELDNRQWRPHIVRPGLPKPLLRATE